VRISRVTSPARRRARGSRRIYFPGRPWQRARGARSSAGAAKRAAELIGVDLKKDPAIPNAHNDAQGVTAEFNLNVLRHLNRELGADFDLRAFRHAARYVAAAGRIEMHLVSLKAQRVTLAGRALEFRADETIHTENSYKYDIAEFQALAVRGIRARKDAPRRMALRCHSLP
jgi:uncharacterized SAM-dependent methyltransferase